MEKKMSKQSKYSQFDDEDYSFNSKSFHKNKKEKKSQDFLTETDWKKKKGSNRRSNQYKDKQKYDYDDDNWN